MPEASQLFPQEEYRRRIKALQTRMAAADIDALLLTTPADVFYVSGFLTRFWESPARPWFVVIPSSGDPVAVIPSIGAALMGQTWMPQIRCWDAPDPRDDGVSLLADTLCSLVRAGGRIGVPKGPETHLRMPLADYDVLLNKIAPRIMIDGTDVIHRVREVKSQAEIDAITETCAIAGRAFDRVAEFAGAGQPLDSVFRAFQIALLQEGARLGQLCRRWCRSERIWRRDLSCRPGTIDKRRYSDARHRGGAERIFLRF